MKMRKSLWLLLGCCLLTGCAVRKEQAKEIFSENEKIEKNQSGDVEEAMPAFPDHIQKDMSEMVKIDADCIYPEGFEQGKGIKVVALEQTLWKKRESIVEKLINNQEIIDFTVNEYGDYQSENYTLTGDGGLAVSTGGFLNYHIRQSNYVLNTIMSDKRFDDYNGDVYQKRTDLAFMSQEDAWGKVRSFLDEMEIEVSDHYQCYVMDYATMEQEEQKIYQMYEQEEVKLFEKKKQWSEEDNCYYFMTTSVCQDYPISSYMSGEGVDEQNVQILYDRTGIISLSVMHHVPMKMESETEIQAPEKVADLLAGVLQDIISDSSYKIEKITLCQAITEEEGDSVKKVVPCWKCAVLIRDGEEDPGYTRDYFYDAETLENIG